MNTVTIYKYTAAVGSGFDGMVSLEPSASYAEATDKVLGEFQIPSNLSLVEDVQGKCLVDSDGRAYRLIADKGAIYADWEPDSYPYEFRVLLKKVSSEIR